MDDDDLEELARASRPTQVSARHVRASVPEIHIHAAPPPPRQRSAFGVAFWATLGVIAALILVSWGPQIVAWLGYEAADASAVAEVRAAVAVDMQVGAKPGHVRLVAQNTSGKRVLGLEVTLVAERKQEATEVVRFPTLDGGETVTLDVPLSELDRWGNALRVVEITGGSVEHVRHR